AVAEPAGRRDRDGLGVVEDPRGRLDAERRVERHGHHADPKRAEESEEELGTGRVDEAELVPRAEAAAGEAGGVAPARVPEPPVCDRVPVEVEVRRVGRERGAPSHHIGERRCRGHVLTGYAWLLGAGVTARTDAAGYTAV